MKNIFFLLMLLLLFITGCKKDQANTDSSNNSSNLVSAPLSRVNFVDRLSIPASSDGYGYSMKPISGIPFSLPSGISIPGGISTSINNCTSSYFYECATDGTLPFYMSLTNSNNVRTTVIFPAGLVIPSMDTVYQNATLVQADTVSMPANATICVNLNAYCINLHRTFNENYVYGAPVICNNLQMNVLIDILANKKSVTEDPKSTVYQDGVIQQAIWDIADSGRMTPADAAAINALP